MDLPAQQLAEAGGQQNGLNYGEPRLGYIEDELQHPYIVI